MKRFESKWESIDNTILYVQGWEPEKAPRAVVSLVHGLGEHTGRYAHVAQMLTNAGYVLAGFDLRGHGKSGGARGHFPSLDVAMRDIQEFYKYLDARYPGIPHFLYGHSLGGLLSLSYVLQNHEGLKGVMVTGAALRSPLQQQKAKLAMARVLGTLAPALTIPSGLEAAAISRDSLVVDTYINDPLVHDKTSLGLGRAVLDAIDLCFTRATDFVPPLLIMHGREDRLTYPAGSEDFAALACQKNQDITLKLLDNMYHEVHNEPEKEEVIRFMSDWLDAHV